MEERLREPKRKAQDRPRKVRLEDIASRCGVSVSTVSRALAGEKGVRDDLRRKVLEAARVARYAVPAPIAGRKIIVAASGAALVDYGRHQFTFHVLDGLRERADQLGVAVETRPAIDRHSGHSVLVDAASDPDVGGVLVLTIDDEATLDEAAAMGKPVVLVNGDDPLMRLSSVAPSNRAAARLACEHLISLGHTRILFLTHPGRRTITRRLEGWRDALAAHGLPHGEALVLAVDDWRPDLATEAVAARLAAGGLGVTAILAAADSLAIGALKALHDGGLRVPADISVMGVDDLPEAAFLDPPLTTMHVPMREIGAAALDLLADAMAGRAQPPRRIEFACPMVPRGSTGPRADHPARTATAPAASAPGSPD